eukprot:9695295-Lingulodinium_polyedra.AAC.1
MENKSGPERRHRRQQVRRLIVRPAERIATTPIAENDLDDAELNATQSRELGAEGAFPDHFDWAGDGRRVTDASRGKRPRRTTGAN